MVLTASFALSPAIGLVCHRRLADMALSAPGRADWSPQDLTPTIEASGPHDFTVRVSIVRPRAPDRSQAKACPAITSTRPTLPASTASHPDVRDDRDTPLVGDETATDMQVICANMKSKYFCKRGWTGKSVNCPSGKITQPGRANRGWPLPQSTTSRRLPVFPRSEMLVPRLAAIFSTWRHAA
jgi:hypothetical protein